MSGCMNLPDTDPTNPASNPTVDAILTGVNGGSNPSPGSQQSVHILRSSQHVGYSPRYPKTPAI